MTLATLRLQIPPRRMLNQRDAAEYCGIPTKRFPIVCPVPPLTMPGGEARYDMLDLDDWIDCLKQGHNKSADEYLERLA